MLDQDHLILRTKCLWMIYKSLHLFPAEAKEELISLIVNKYFYSLFFSWSWNVRSIISYLLLYQLHFIHFELINIINDKGKSDANAQSAQYQNTIMRNLVKPVKKSPIIIDSDDEAHYDEHTCILFLLINIAMEYEQIGILHQTEVIKLLKDKMEEIDFLTEYFTGK